MIFFRMRIECLCFVVRDRYFFEFVVDVLLEVRMVAEAGMYSK